MELDSLNTKPLRILISNDDGVHAQGIHALADELRSIAEVIIVAPDRNRSGASNSLTLEQPLRVTEIAPNTYSVQGTPTDCVHFALNELMKDDLPDLVLSGINHGANLGMTFCTLVPSLLQWKGIFLACKPLHFHWLVNVILSRLLKLLDSWLSNTWQRQSQPTVC